MKLPKTNKEWSRYVSPHILVIAPHFRNCGGHFPPICKFLDAFLNDLYRLFQQYISNIASASAPIDAFLGCLKPVLGTILFLSHWLLSHITIVETMDSSERKFESCRNDYHQSLERILGEPGIEPATSCSTR